MTQQFRVKLRAVRFKGGGEVRLLPKRPKPDAINERAIAMAEEVLTRLRSGETVAVGFTEVRTNGTTSTGYCLQGNHDRMVSAVQTLAFRLQDEFK